MPGLDQPARRPDGITAEVASTHGLDPWLQHLAPLILVGGVALLLGAPLAGVFLSALRAAPDGVSPERLIAEVGGYPWLLARTFALAGAIAVSATVVAAPAAWLLRRCTRIELALAVAPLLAPSYLAYAAYSTLREQGTLLGDLLGRAPPWVAALVGQWLAGACMVLWVWPLPAIIMALGFSRIPTAVIEALQLDGASPARRALELARMTRPAVAQAVLTAGLLMVGSAVPLHLALVQTHAIVIWKCLDLFMAPWKVWLIASPLLVVALLAAEVIARRLSPRVRGDTLGPAAPRGQALRPDATDDASDGAAPGFTGSAPARPAPWAARGPAWALWAASIPLPLVLFWIALRDRQMLVRFWRDDGQAAAASACVALFVALASALAVLAVWFTLSGVARRGRLADLASGLCLRAFLVGGLLPGVLVGSAVSEAYGRRVPIDLPEAERLVLCGLAVAMAHLTRFGFLAVCAGWLLSRSEPAALRDLRLTESSLWRAWLHGAVRPRLGVVLGVGLACGALSFSEIESSVMIQPPGLPSMARSLLEHLHYLRDQQVAAAAVNLMLAGLAVAVGAAWLASGGGQLAAGPRLVSRPRPSAVSYRK